MKQITKKEYLRYSDISSKFGIEHNIQVLSPSHSQPSSFEQLLQFGDNIYIQIKLSEFYSIIGLLNDDGSVTDSNGELIGKLCIMFDLPIDTDDCEVFKGEFEEIEYLYDGVSYVMRFYDGIAIGVNKMTNKPVYMTYPTTSMLYQNKLLRNQLYNKVGSTCLDDIISIARVFGSKLMELE